MEIILRLREAQVRTSRASCPNSRKKSSGKKNLLHFSLYVWPFCLRSLVDRDEIAKQQNACNTIYGKQLLCQSMTLRRRGGEEAHGLLGHRFIKHKLERVWIGSRLVLTNHKRHFKVLTAAVFKLRCFPDRTDR